MRQFINILFSLLFGFGWVSSWTESCCGVGWCLVLFDERNTCISTSRQTRAGIPSIRSPASNEIISDSVELWDTDVCFLHIQLTVTNVRLSKIRKISLEVDVESTRSPAKSERWNRPNRQCWAVLPTWQYCQLSLVWSMYEINLAKRLSHAPVHLVTDRASMFTDHTMSGLPIRAMYKQVKTIWFTNGLKFILFEIIFVQPGSCTFIIIPFGLHWRWVHPKYTWSRNEVGSSRSTFFINFFHMGAMFRFFQPWWCHPRTSMKTILVSDERTSIPNSILFSHPSCDGTSSNCLSHESPASGCPYKFRSRGTTGSSLCDVDVGHLCRGRRIHMSGHSDFGSLSNLGSILHFYLSAHWYGVSCLSTTIP